MIKNITEIVIRSGNTVFNIYDEIKLTVHDFVSKRELSKLSLKDYIHITQDSGWSEQDLEMDFHNMDSNKYDAFLEFIQEENKEFVLTFTYGTKRFITYVFLEKSSIISNNNNAHELRKLLFVQQTPFFRIKTQDYTAKTAAEASLENYPYTYPLTYGYDNGNYSSGSTEINVSCDGVSPVKVEIFGATSYPEVYINAAKEERNSFISKSVVSAGEILVCSSFMPEKGIRIISDTGSNTNVEQEREFLNSKGYLSMYKGLNKVRFKNVLKARLTVYEKYFSLR